MPVKEFKIIILMMLSKIEGNPDKWLSEIRKTIHYLKEMLNKET
jgi:hypothetical protein